MPANRRSSQSVVIPRLFRLFVALALLGQCLAIETLLAAGGETDIAQETPFERRPYEIRLLAAFDKTSFDSVAVETTLSGLRQAVRRSVAGAWSFRAGEIEWLGPVDSNGLKRLGRSHLEDHYPDQTADVWFVVTIEAQRIGARISVRSWQPEFQVETPVASTDVVDHREIPLAILRLCRDLIRPIGVVEQVDDRVARIRLRAGELVSPDPSFSPVAKGDLLSPMLAYRDKNKVIEKLQTIPWTYISVDSVDGSTVMGTVQSGLKLSLGGKKRSRIDTVVVKLRPQFASTRVELLTQSKPILPLVAHRIEVRTKPVIPRATDDNPDVDPASTMLNELLTDRRGLTTVPVESEHPLVWLFAFSGQNLLARVPFVPGIVQHVRLEVPDDSTRLAAEADLQMLQGEVIDAVALRNTAFATMRAAAKNSDWKTVNQKMALLNRQQDVSALTDRLNAVRVAATTAAKARKDRTAESRINRMCDETLTLIKTHLSDDKLSSIKEEMESLESAAEEEKN